MRFPVLASLAAIVCIALLSASAHAEIVFKGDFEGGNFSGWLGRDYCCGYSQQIVTSPARAGKHAARFEIRYTDPVPSTVASGVRSEVDYHNRRFGKLGGPDEWYGFSTYFPPDYKVDTAYEVVAQWKSWPDKGEEHGSPVLGMYTKDGNVEFWIRYTSKPIWTPIDVPMVLLWRGPYQPGAWTDWAVHVKWSCKDAKPLNTRCQSMPDGFTQLWKNGEKVADYKGPNAYNDTQEKQNINFRLGTYKYVWNNHQPTDVTTRVIYYDEIRIGDSNSSYAEVAPGGSPPPPAPQPVPAPSSGNLALSATATASSQWSADYTPSMARDGNAGTRWNSAYGEKAGAWLALDFGAPKAINKVVITEGQDLERVTGYSLQSWNGSAWQDIASGGTIGSKRTHTFTPVTTQKIRLLVKSLIAGEASTTPTISEFEAYGTAVGGPVSSGNLAASAAASASSQWSAEYAPSMARDGNAGTRWNSASGNQAGAWLALDFGTAKPVGRVVLTEGQDLDRITGYSIQSWNGNAWQDIASAGTLGGKRTHTFTPVTTQKIRLLVKSLIAGESWTTPTISEFEAYGQ